MCSRRSRVQEIILSLLLVGIGQSSYIYVNSPKPLWQATASCHGIDGRLVQYGDDLASLGGTPPNGVAVWTGTNVVLSPWIRLVGCYNYQPSANNEDIKFLVKTSAAACEAFCRSKSNNFALHDKRCVCVTSSEDFVRTEDASCNLTCDGSDLAEPCGGVSREWSLYMTPTYNQDTSVITNRCVAAACDGLTVKLYAQNCSNELKSVCNTNSQLSKMSWISAKSTCLKTYNSSLISDPQLICRPHYHQQTISKNFWIAEFRGEADSTGNITQNSIISRCKLIKITKDTDNTTVQFIQSNDCMGAIRPFICKIGDHDPGSDSRTRQTRITNHLTSSKPTITQIPNIIHFTSSKPITDDSIHKTDQNCTNATRTYNHASLEHSTTGKGAVAAAVSVAIVLLVVIAVNGIFWKRKLFWFKREDNGQTAINRTYDPSFKQHEQTDTMATAPVVQTYEVLREESANSVENAAPEIDEDIYGSPTFDYDIETPDNPVRTPYLDMGGKDEPTLSGQQEYVYMGEDTLRDQEYVCMSEDTLRDQGYVCMSEDTSVTEEADDLYNHIKPKD